LPKLSSLEKRIKNIYKTGLLTNGRYVKEFEERSARFLGVKNTVAVSSGTAALTLAVKCLGIKGEAILPSFTFTSTGHALLWCGVRPVFADINPATFNLDPESIKKKITGQTSAIIATHVFSNPCQINEIQKIAQDNDLKVIYDAAHAFGSKYKGRSVAEFGDASIFSFTPTKVITMAEGGLVVVKDKETAEKIKLGRNNGDSFNREEEFLGITARLSEFSAILGLESLKMLPKLLKKRFELVGFYKKQLAGISGISFQEINASGSSVYKDFVILVDPEKYGNTRNSLMKELEKNKIQTKVYFDPPLHLKKVYSEFSGQNLPSTRFVSDRIMSLPFYSDMLKKDIAKVCLIIRKFQKNL